MHCSKMSIQTRLLFLAFSHRVIRFLRMSHQRTCGILPIALISKSDWTNANLESGRQCKISNIRCLVPLAVRLYELFPLDQIAYQTLLLHKPSILRLPLRIRVGERYSELSQQLWYNLCHLHQTDVLPNTCPRARSESEE